MDAPLARSATTTAAEAGRREDREYVRGMNNAITVYASLDDLKGRVRLDVLLKCLDWNRDSVLDEEAFLSALARPTSIDLEIRFSDLLVKVPGHVLREMALDWYVWRMAIMWPTHMQVDAGPLAVKLEEDALILYEKYSSEDA